MYVVIFEVMHFEKSKKNVTGMVQFGSILIGFIVTVLIKILSKKYYYYVKKNPTR